MVALRQRVRREIAAGKWKSRNCGDCPYALFARGELGSKADLRANPRLKQPKRLCKNCPSRGFW